jgi:hypothetical protein
MSLYHSSGNEDYYWPSYSTLNFDSPGLQPNRLQTKDNIFHWF